MTDTRQYVLGIDAGTGGLRAGLFDLQGIPLGFADQPYATSYPQPGWAVQDPGDWWLALVTSVRTCLAQAGVEPSRVRGLAIDAPANIFLVDSDGTPLTPGLLWMDLRGAEQAGRLTATNDPVLRYCGGTVPAEWPLPKALSVLYAHGRSAAVLLNCGEDVAALVPHLLPPADGAARPTRAPGTMDLRTYGIGAQILRSIGITKMKLLGSPRRMPSMIGYGLEVTGFLAADPPQA